MIVVIIIIGILAGIAVPAYLQVLPGQELKGDVRKLSFALQRARQAASAYNRPARVLVDCTAATINFAGRVNPCRLAVELSVYDTAGLVRRWVPVQAGKLDLSAQFRFAYTTDAAVPRGQFNSYRGFFNNFTGSDGTGHRTYGVSGKDGFNNDSLVVVYVPSGEAVTFSKVSLRLFTARKPDMPGWTMDIVNSTGYVRLRDQA
jgi:Tfp pilus assembly protein FimT